MAHASDAFCSEMQALTVEAVQAMTDDELRQHPVLGVMFRRGWVAKMEANNRIKRNHSFTQPPLPNENITLKATTKSTSEASTHRRTTAATLTAAYHLSDEERVPPLLSDWSVAEHERTQQEKPVQEERKRQHRSKIGNSYSRYLSRRMAGKLQPNDETK